jgi:hypothetical protein
MIKMTMKLLITILCSSITLNCFAQYIGLNKKEISDLQRLVVKDSSAKSFYASIKRTANDVLTQMPDPIDTVVSEGHLATDPQKIRTVKSLKDINKIYALAIAYVIEGNKNYLQKAGEYITAWATINQPQGNPINDTKFEDLLFAYDLIKIDVSTEQKNTINSWLEKMASNEIKTALQKTKKTSYNNWNSHRLKTIGLIAYILNNNTYKAYIDIELPAQIEKNLLPDGSGIDFHERDALHYHVYTLEPLISLSTVLKRATGKDFYHYTSPSGASIKKSIDFLIPFVTGEKTHGEYVNSTVAFDKKRADNKEPGFQIGAPFKPAAGLPVLVQASYFEPFCINVVRKVLNTSATYPTWEAVIIGVRK